MSLHKLIALFLFMLAILAAIVPISLLESTRMPDWQAELSHYLEVFLLTFHSRFPGSLWENRL